MHEYAYILDFESLQFNVLQSVGIIIDVSTSSAPRLHSWFHFLISGIFGLAFP